MASQAPTMTETQPIAAQEQTLSINPESPDASESGSSPFFQLALIVAVIFPIAWGVGAARLKGATAVTATAAATESDTTAAKPAVPRFQGNRRTGDDLFRAGNFEAALHHYRSLGSDEILRLPQELLFRIALCQEGLGLWDEALAGLRSVAAGADLPSLSSAATLGQARVWLRLHQPDRAVPLLRSLALRPALPGQLSRELAFLEPLVTAMEMSETRAVTATADADLPLLTDPHALAEQAPLPEHSPQRGRHPLNDFTPVADSLDWPLTTALDAIEPLPHHADSHAAPLAFQANSTVPAASIHCTHELTEDSARLCLNERFVTAVSNTLSLGAVLEEVAQQCGMTLNWRDDTHARAFARVTDIAVETVPVCSLLTAISNDLHAVWFSDESTLTLARSSASGETSRAMVARTLLSLATLMPEQRLAGHARFAVGRLARVDDHFAEAARQYSLLVGRSSTSLAIRAAFNAGECYYRLGDLRRAGDQLEYIVHGAPGHELHTRATIWHGRFLLDRGEYREAAFQLQRAAGGRIPPDEQAYAAVFLAMAHLMQEKSLAAAEALHFEQAHFENRAVRHAASFLTAFTRFRQLTGSQQQREAAFLFRALVAIESDTEWLGPTGQLLIGRALRELGVGERAIALYERELRRNPPAAIAHEMRFAIAEQQQRDQHHAAAKAGWQELATSGAGGWKHKAQLRLAELALADGAWEECLAACRALHGAVGVSRQETLQLMGRAFEQSGNDSLAAQCYAGRLPPP